MREQHGPFTISTDELTGLVVVTVDPNVRRVQITTVQVRLLADKLKKAADIVDGRVGGLLH